MEIVTQAVRPSTAIDYETAISHDITVMATSDDGSNSTGSFIVSVVNDPNDDALNTPPTQLGGIHRFGATFADGDIRQLMLVISLMVRIMKRQLISLVLPYLVQLQIRVSSIH